MPEKVPARNPAKKSGELPVCEVTDVEREAGSGDTAVAPGEERQSDRLRPGRRHHGTDEDPE
jgi:hypothetical protein